MSDLLVKIDGETWEPSNDGTAEYDAIHTAAGAVLSGANNVQVIRTDETQPCSCGMDQACDLCGGKDYE